MKAIPCEKSSGDVFADMGFAPATAAELTVKSSLIAAISDTIKERDLTQTEAAQLCGTDQPTLSKILRGRMESITIDRLAAWLNALAAPSKFASDLMIPRPNPASLSSLSRRRGRHRLSGLDRWPRTVRLPRPLVRGTPSVEKFECLATGPTPASLRRSIR